MFQSFLGYCKIRTSICWNWSCKLPSFAVQKMLTVQWDFLVPTVLRRHHWKNWLGFCQGQISSSLTNFSNHNELFLKRTVSILTVTLIPMIEKWTCGWLIFITGLPFQGGPVSKTSEKQLQAQKISRPSNARTKETNTSSVSRQLSCCYHVFPRIVP